MKTLAKGLFFNDDQINELKDRISMPQYSALWQDIKSTADKVCEVGGLEFPEDTYTIYYYVRKRLSDLGMACLLTGEQKYIDAIKKNLRELAQKELNFWIGPEYPNRPRTRIYHGEEVFAGELETATLTAGFIMAYDWAYSFLDSEDKSLILSCLKEKAYMLLKNSTLFQSENWVMNHLCVIGSSFAQIILLLEDEGIAFEEDLALVQKALKLWMQKMESDGSYGEGYHYWAYPVNCLFSAVHTLKFVKGIELDGLHLIKNVMEWAIYNQVGKYEISGYETPVAVAANAHDSPFLFQMEAPEVLLYANHLKNPMAQWYLNEFLMNNPARPDGLHTTWHVCNSLLFALYNPEMEARSPESLNIAPARVFHDTGFTYIRDSFKNCGKLGGDTLLMLQSGGGGKARSHQHYDKNSFTLFSKGEYFIVEPGHSCYRGESHHDYDTKTSSHNTVNIDGKDQYLEFVERGMLHDEVKDYTSHHNRAEVVSKAFYDEISFVASEGRRCYKPYLNEFMRKIWFVRPNYFIIWDRIDASNQQGGIQSGFNLNNYDGNLQYEITGGNIKVSRPKADLSIQFVSPKEVAFDITNGRLHTAYHILKNAAVEGKDGSAKRVNLKAGLGDLKAVDYVYLICPLDKGCKPPKVTTLESVFEQARPQVFESLKIQIDFQGNSDIFTLDAKDVRFERAGGAHYTF